AGGLTAEGPGEALQGFTELTGDDEHGVRLALGHLRKCLEVLVGEQLGAGLGGVYGVEDRLNGLRLGVGGQNARLCLTLGLQNRRLALTLSIEDGGLLGALCGEDRSPAAAFGTHLLLHGVLDAVRGID